MRYLIIILLVSCAIPKGVQPRVFTDEHLRGELTFPYTHFRTGEYRGEDSLCWESHPEEMFSFYTLEENGDLTRQLGNVTIGYARKTGDMPDRKISPKRFDVVEIDWPYDLCHVTICEEYNLMVFPHRYNAEFPIYFLYTKE